MKRKTVQVTFAMGAKPTRYGHRGLPPLSFEIWEQCFSFEMWNEGVDISAIDAFLADGPIPEDVPPALLPDGRKGWAPEGDTRLVLLDERRKAFEAYVRGDHELAVALAKGLRRVCEQIGFRHAAEPLAEATMQRRTSLRRNSAVGVAKRRRYTDSDYSQWSEMAARKDVARLGKRQVARLIASELRLDPAAVETIRKRI